MLDNQKTLPITIVILKGYRNPPPDQWQRTFASAQVGQKVLVVADPNPITDFSQVRNEALKKAQAEWVLFLDSDEVLEIKNFKLVKNLLQNKKVSGLSVKRKDYFHNKPLRFGETGQTSIVRVLRKNHGHFEGRVHEVAHVKGEVWQAPITLHHYPHQSVASFIEKISHYAQLASLDKKEELPPSALSLWIELLSYPFLKFFVNWFGRAGFLDGNRGLTYALVMSLHSLFVRIYRYEQQA